jgi:putative cell wall-binding protein
MGKCIGMLLSFVLLFGISLPTVFAEGPGGQEENSGFGEQEPNDAMATANVILKEGNVSGSLNNTDTDFFKVSIPNKGSFSLYGTTFSYEVGAEINMYVDQGEKLESACESFTEYGSFYCEQTLDPGTYYIQLNSVNDTQNYGIDYEFSTFVTEPGVQRISGETRYDTATNIANDGWSGGASEIVLATGQNFPDALAAGPLAYSLSAPILLTTKDVLPKSVIQFIQDKGVNKVTIIGGNEAVSSQVESYLRNLLKLEIYRISGNDRFETAAKIADELPESYEARAIVVNGRNYPDALSASSYAAQNGFPILLTESDRLPAVTAEMLSGEEMTTVVGGTQVISDTVFNQLPDPERISGKDRYETSAKMAELVSSPSSFVATGTNFADALSGSVLAAMYGEPIILTRPTGLSEEAKAFFNYYGVMNYTILGGTSAVGSEVEQELWNIANSQL